jgi:multidrug efflux pump subunit AcrA (membrane-fusion protein)
MAKLWKTLIILIVLAGASAAVYAWTRNGKKGDGGLKQVDVTTGSIVEKAVAVGQIQPRQKFSVKSKISGIVRRTMIQIGDTVHAGDPLFEIAPDPTPMEVTDVERQVDSAQASFRRAESVKSEAYADGVANRDHLDLRRSVDRGSFRPRPACHLRRRIDVRAFRGERRNPSSSIPALVLPLNFCLHRVVYA